MLEAEGKKQAEILNAEGEKQAAILVAEGEKIAQITRAEGEAEARITLANAETEAIIRIKTSIPGVDPLPYLVALNYIKALPEITKGKNDKLVFMPYEASAVVGSLGMIKELFKQQN
jgi:regulator of protease activity HflC (stomatin/prohibitin superfamily)